MQAGGEPVGSPPLAAPVEPDQSEGPDAAQRSPAAEARLAQEGQRSKRGEATLWIEVVSADTGAALVGVHLGISSAGVLSYSGEGVSALEGAPGKFPDTDAQGRARFRLPPGAYTLHVSWGERGGGRKDIEVAELADGEERTQRIELPTANDLRFLGRVLDEGSGAPIAGADVLLFEGSSWGTSWPIYQPSEVIAELARTSTDAEGRFEVWSASWKRTMVRVRAPKLVPAFVPVQPGHSERELEIVLRLGGSAVLVATIEQAGKPAVGISVCLLMEGKGFVCSGQTDPDGRCRIEDVPAGVRLEVRLDRPAPGGEEDIQWRFPFQRLHQDIPELLVLEPGETREQTWQLGVLCTLRGIARTPEGRPLPGLLLRLMRGEADDEPSFIRPFSQKFPDVVQTDEHGAFVIADLPSDIWWLCPEPTDGRNPNLEAAPFTTRVAIPEGAREMDIDLEVHCGLYIRGIVEDPDGNPLERASVDALPLEASTDAHGQYRLGPLVPGAYELSAGKKGFAPSALVNARAGDEGVRLRLERGGTLRVRIVDAAGNPLPGAQPSLLRANSGSIVGRGKGESEFRTWSDLPASRYSLTATLDESIGWIPDIGVEAGSESTETLVVAELAARLRVSSADAALPYCYLHVFRNGVPVAWTSLKGLEDATLSVPAGPCELVLAGRKGDWKQTVSVLAVAGEETEVVFPSR